MDFGLDSHRLEKMATALEDEPAKLGVVRTREIVAFHLLVWFVEGKNCPKGSKNFFTR